VYDNARVCGDAVVSGNAQVYDARGLLVVGPIGLRRSFLTAHTDAELGVRYSTGCFSGSRADLIRAIKETHDKASLYAKQYAAALAMAKVCVKPYKKGKK